MPETTIKVAAMMGIEPIRSSNSLRVRFRDAANNPYALDFPEGTISGLIVALTAQLAHLTRSGVGQPMTLTSGQPFTIADGRVGLELLLEHVLRLPVLFPKESIQTLRKSLDELERLSRQTPPPPRQN
jgi:hypothetical protein